MVHRQWRVHTNTPRPHGLCSLAQGHFVRSFSEVGKLLTFFFYNDARSGRVYFGIAYIYVFSGSHDGTIKIWQWASGECLKTLKGHALEVRSLQFVAGKLISASYDKTIRVWKVESGEVVRTMTGHWDWISSIEPLSRNKLASGSLDDSIKIWNLDNGECVRTINGHAGHVSSLAHISDDFTS